MRFVGGTTRGLTNSTPAGLVKNRRYLPRVLRGAINIEPLQGSATDASAAC